MKKKIFSIALILALLATVLLPTLSIQADSPHDKVPPGQIERLEHGWRRLDPNARAHGIGTEMRGGKKYAIYEAEISSLPTTLDDCVTLIDTNWYMLTDLGGQSYFQTGVNLFTARVLGGRVSVEDEDGRLSIWNSRVTIGNDTFSGGIARIANDPINENYEGNCLLWEYGNYSSGWWIFGTSAKVERYLRVIEGSISELWILPIDPKADVIIKLNESVESNFSGRINWLNVYDAEYNPLQVTKTKFGTYVIDATEFVDREFPVTIDPSEYFDAAYYDAHLQNYDTNYNTCRTTANASYYSDSTPGINVGQRYSTITTKYFITRASLPFYTASLPNDINITDARLYLAGSIDNSDTDFYITVQSGMPTYPHLALEAGDYSYTHYSGNGGTLYSSGWSVGPYNVLDLNSTGMSWINLTGWTKFMLRSDQDIAGSAPTDGEYVGFRSRDYGQGWEPGLYVIYSVPIDLPDVTTMAATGVDETSADLRGYLSDDGGEPCSVRFQYGTSTSYGTDTAWDSGYETGDYFDKTVYGLDPGTTHHFRAQATNSEGTDSGSDKTFITLPYAPYNFSATAGDGTVALAWTKGSGANRTMIRRSATSYPSSPTDGTQIYFDTGTSHNDNDVSNGTEYFYSAWSEVSGVYSSTRVVDSALPDGPSVGTVTTLAASPVGVNSATLNLNVDDLGGSAHVHVRFQYYKDPGAWPGTETDLSGEEGLGPYTDNIAGLDADSLYHQRAKITNDTGTAYGADVPFTTGANFAPEMTTQAATGLQLFSATLNAAVADDGGLTCTVWFEWGLTDSYGNSTPTISGLSTNDTFYYGLTDLESNTTYHFRAVGQNTEGISYGDDVSFLTTTPTAPTCRTDAASDVGANQAQLNATVLTDGSVECEVRFQWGLTDAYGTDTEWIAGYTKDQTFSKLISGLTIGETYHFRAQVKNAGGTGSGSDVTFITVFSAPTGFRAKAISSTTINLNWTKSGDLTYIRFKLGGFPIDHEDGDPVYFGPDEFTSISGLLAGNTYYFRAWSQREGDVWADGYADDVATTQAVVPTGEDERPGVVPLLEEPESWVQEPSGSHLTLLPFYQEHVAFANTIGMQEGFYFLLGAILCTFSVSFVVLKYSSNLRNAIIAGAIVMLICGSLEMISVYFVIFYIVSSGGLVYVLSRQ